VFCFFLQFFEFWWGTVFGRGYFCLYFESVCMCVCCDFGSEFLIVAIGIIESALFVQLSMKGE